MDFVIKIFLLLFIIAAVIGSIHKWYMIYVVGKYYLSATFFANVFMCCVPIIICCVAFYLIRHLIKSI